MGFALPYKSKVINDLTKVKFYDTATNTELTTLADLKAAITTSKLVIEGWGQFGSGTKASDVKNVSIYRGSNPVSQKLAFSQDDFSITAPAAGENKYAYVRVSIQDFSYSSRVAMNRRDNILGKTYQVEIDSTSVPVFLAKWVNQLIAAPARFPDGDDDLVYPVITSGSTVIFVDQTGTSQTEVLASDWKFGDLINGNSVATFTSIAGATVSTDAICLVAKDEELAVRISILDEDLLNLSPLVALATTVTKTDRFQGRGTYEFLARSVVLNNEVNSLPDFAVMNDEQPVRGALYSNLLFSVDLSDDSGNYANSNALINRRYNYELWFNEALPNQFGNVKADAPARDASTEKSILLAYFLTQWAGNTYKIYNENNQVPGNATGTVIQTGNTAWNEAVQSGAERVGTTAAVAEVDVTEWAD